MKDDQDKPLFSQPIHEVTISKIDQIYVTRVLWYLEHDLHCHVTALEGSQGFRITFPKGTLQETYAGQSTQWTHKTTIRFANGVTLRKYVVAPLNPTRHGLTSLAIPNTVLDGPEPPPDVSEPPVDAESAKE